MPILGPATPANYPPVIQRSQQDFASNPFSFPSRFEICDFADHKTTTFALSALPPSKNHSTNDVLRDWRRSDIAHISQTFEQKGQ